MFAGWVHSLGWTPERSHLFAEGRHEMLFRILLQALLLVALTSRPGFSERVDKVDRAVEELLGRMTLAEKIGQRNLIAREEGNTKQLEEVQAGCIGNVLNVVHPERVALYKEAARQSRLAIP